MLLMEQNTYIEFYSNTIEDYSNQMKRQISIMLEKERKIRYEKQQSFLDDKHCMYFDKKDYANIIKKTVSDINFINFYDKFDFLKMYKHSVPFFYEGFSDEIIEGLLNTQNKLKQYSEEIPTEYTIASGIEEVIPVFYKLDDESFFIKFVYQKFYFKPDTGEEVNYRYVIVVYFNKKSKMLDIRYDSLKFFSGDSRLIYNKNIENILFWLKSNLKINIYNCDSKNFLDIINVKDSEVKVFKQMMDMGSSGQAELTASEDSDFILPFIGEIKELIDENEELFNKVPEIKKLLEDYLTEKEITASYPFVYLMWKRAVVAKQFIIKVTFSYFENNYIQLHHITGNCIDVRMERMNDAIQYFGTSGALVKGEEI